MTVNGLNTQKLGSMKMSGLDTTNLWIGESLGHEIDDCNVCEEMCV